MKKALVLVAVVVLVVAGLPLLVGTAGMASCPECGPALFPAVWCIAVVITAGAAGVAVMARALRSRDEVVQLELHPFLIERPPRLA